LGIGDPKLSLIAKAAVMHSFRRPRWPKHSRAKIARHYGKPAVAEFWLVIFTAASVAALGSHWNGGVFHEGPMANGARKWLEQAGLGPFDKNLLL